MKKVQIPFRTTEEIKRKAGEIFGEITLPHAIVVNREECSLYSSMLKQTKEYRESLAEKGKSVYLIVVENEIGGIAIFPETATRLLEMQDVLKVKGYKKQGMNFWKER